MNQHLPPSNVRPVQWQSEDFVSHSYFVVMVDYGRDTSKVHGLEAVVSPEMTRSGALEKVREVLGDGNEIAFVHHIRMNDVPADVTEELVNEARDAMAMENA